jgi:glutamine amidotransferase
MIVIIDYGVGNLGSIKNMISRIGMECIISSRKEDIEKASKLILPGVGNFAYGMQKLYDSNLIEVIECLVFRDKLPILGICLGAQLMCEFSEEGNFKGLGWFNANVVKFNIQDEKSKYKVPHMGWSNLNIIKPSVLFDEIDDAGRFYFVHSYHFTTDDNSIVVSTANYCYNFACVLQLDNIFAVQFHPEKSHKFGMQLLRNFLLI